MSAPILSIDAPLKRGDHGPLVRVAQEWLCLALAAPYPARVDDLPLALTLDGDFGPAMEDAVRRWQQLAGLSVTGVIEPYHFSQLVAPMKRATSPIDTAPTNRSFPRTVLAAAFGFLAEQPREVGGDNQGPWVRRFCGGAEGLPWCAGFASTCVSLAVESLRMSSPIVPELACDLLAKDAERGGLLVHGGGQAPPVGLQPGSLFLVKAAAGADRRCHHTGVVSHVLPDRVKTIEGNTNAGGSPNGYGVFARERHYADLDFIAFT